MKNKFYTTFSTPMRGFILGLFSLLSVMSAQAQTATDGDYRSAKAMGNWSDADMWETRTAGTWAITATAPTASNNVYIQTGHAITVDVLTASCKDLQITASGVGTALAIGTNTLQVNGKMRAYSGTAVTGSADGVFYTQTSITSGFTSTAATTSSSGSISIVGSSRTVFTTAEWGGSGFSGCDFVINMTSGQIATCAAIFKFKSVTVMNGSTLDATTGCRIQADNGAGGGDITIKTGGKIISARSPNTTQVMSGSSSTTKCGTVTIENGATLELTGTTPSIDCTIFTNNGTVAYTKAGTQTLLQRGSSADGTTAFNAYKNLVLGNTSTKTPFASITVSNLLQFTGTATFAPTASLTLTMLNGSTVDRGATGTSLPSTAGAVFYGTTAADLVNVTISTTLSNSNELPSAPTPGKVGTLTVNSGVTYTITGGRTVTNLVNNNIVALAPATTLTLNINGDISGSGTITGHANASVAIGGTTGGNAGTLNFTSGSQIANNMTINRTGATPSVTLGTPLTLNAATGNLTLTSGQIILGSNTLTTAIITGGSASSYVVTNGSGVLTSPTTANTLKLFPIGTSTTYDPVEVTPTNGVNFSAKVSAAAPSGVSDNTKMAPREWNVSATGAGSTVMGLTNGGAAYTPTTPSIGHYTGTAWEEFTATYASNKWTATNASGSFSPFGSGNYGAFNASVLAVELSNFQVKTNQKAALLTWTTASEKDNAYFEVQQSTNGIDFQTIGQVKGNGTTTAATTYNFEHSTPSVSVNYYRLKQVDFNGTATLSAVRSVVFGKTGLVVKATLVTETLDIAVSDAEMTPLSIFNLSGQNVMNLKAQGTQRVNVSALPAGMYVIRVGTGEAVRFVKQ